MECYRFYSLREVRQAAAAAGGARLALPADLLAATELLRGTERLHMPLAGAKGEIRVSKARKAPGRARAGDAAFFWRYVWDSSGMQVLTDRPVTDFIQE
jgi:hypothetical protein